VKFEGWAVTGWASVALASMVALILLALGYSEASVRVVARSTAQTSAGLFLAAFTASSLVRYRPAPSTRWLLRNRRYLGVSFAVSHFVHLAALILLGVHFPEPFVSELNLVTILGGGLAYAFVASMALTSSDRAQAWLGMKRWRGLHVVGSYYIWIIFLQSYLSRAWNEPSYIPVTILFGIAPLLRVTAGRALRESATHS